jgi:glycosyltransferase involved in cell wall biosynthesis
MRGIYGYARNFFFYQAEILRCIDSADIIWGKQSFVATVCALWKKRKSAFTVTQMIGDPGDTIEMLGGPFWNAVAKTSRWVNRFILRNADACIFVSEALKNKYALAAKPNFVLHEGRVKTTQVVKRISSSSGLKKTVLYVGRLSHEKGVDVLVKAFAMASRQSDLQLRIVGDGSQRAALSQLVSSLGISEKVDFVGKVTWGWPLFKEMENATMMVLPSFTEGLPLVILECQSQGTPVIASDVGGVKECLLGGLAGILVPPGDVVALANAIVELESNEDRRMKLANEGLMNAARNTIDAQMAKLKEIFIDRFDRWRQPGFEEHYVSEKSLD